MLSPRRLKVCHNQNLKTMDDIPERQKKVSGRVSFVLDLNRGLSREKLKAAD